MWTPQNRKRYDRSRLRYPSDLTDEELGACRACDPACQAAATPKRQRVEIDRKRMILRTPGETSSTGVRSISSLIKNM